jgi:HK97 family phage portal protein
VEQRNYSISDPNMFALFGGAPSLAGVTVSETSALGLSAVFRSVSLIAGSIAALPLRTVQTRPDGTTQRTTSWLDTPAGPDGITDFEFFETMLLHLLLQGNFYGLKIFGGAGQLLGLQPVHPSAVGIEVKDGRKFYRVSLANGTTMELTDREVVHIPALSSDGIRGLSPITIARNSFGTSIAGETASSRLFGSGLLASAIATVDEQLPEEDAKAIKDGLDRKLSGVNNAGEIAFINRNVKITPWSISPADAQFLESRAFQVDEVSRWFGIPPHLLGQTQKQTSFGAGLTEQNRGYARYTLAGWTSRIEARLSRLLSPSLACEFDYSGLVQPDPETEITLLIAQVQAGLLTVDEARQIRNMPALPKQPQPIAVPA